MVDIQHNQDKGVFDISIRAAQTLQELKITQDRKADGIKDVTEDQERTMHQNELIRLESTDEQKNQQEMV